MAYDAKRGPAYRATAEIADVDVPPTRYLAIDGTGDPNTSPAYADAVAALYTAAYAVRAVTKARGEPFVVGPLEALWYADDPTVFVTRDKAAWSWTLLLPLPPFADDADAAAGLAAAARRKPDLPVGRVAVRELAEGRCLQVLHVGPYDAEGPTLARLHHEVMPALGLTWAGPHHEIYLGDPRRVAPQRLRTVLRQPVRPREGRDADVPAP